MSLLDNYPYFNNFILDTIVFCLALTFVFAVGYAVFFGGSILYALIRAAWDKLTNTKKQTKNGDDTQVVFLRKEPKNPKRYE